MCGDCAGAHRNQRCHQLTELNDEEVATRSRTFCVNHTLQPITAYCADCGNAVCGQCCSLGGPCLGLESSNCRCPHSALCDLTSAASTGRTQLQQDEQV